MEELYDATDTVVPPSITHRKLMGAFTCQCLTAIAGPSLRDINNDIMIIILWWCLLTVSYHAMVGIQKQNIMWLHHKICNYSTFLLKLQCVLHTYVCTTQNYIIRPLQKTTDHITQSYAQLQTKLCTYTTHTN